MNLEKESLNEFGKGEDKVAINQIRKITEQVSENAVWKIGRWASEEDKKTGKIYSKEEALKLFGAPQFTEIERNLLLNVGINELWTILCSASGTKYDNTNAQLGVGDSSVAEAATQTALQGTNTLYKAMLTGYPTYGTSQQAVWKSQFTETEANFAWNEFAVRNGATANKLLNRKVSAQGTKVVNQVWELTLTITIS